MIIIVLYKIAMKSSVLQNLTDEEILKEFVKRFECDGAVLVYFEEELEVGFGAWNNSLGRTWVNQFFKRVKQEICLRPSLKNTQNGIRRFISNKEKFVV